MEKLLMFYVPCEEEQEARKIAKELLAKDLVVCGNILQSVQSIYKWKGKVEESQEVVLILKGRLENEKKIREEIERMHSYEVPAIISFEARVNEGFFRGGQ